MTPTYKEAKKWFTPARRARFWNRWVKITPEGCWLWQLCKTDTGHGQVNFNGDKVRVHRLTWLLARERDIPDYIPDTPDREKEDPNSPSPLALFVVRHRCDLKHCCNPAHLVGGTHGDNREDYLQIERATQAILREWGIFRRRRGSGF